jgi:hypothetical protein
MSQRLRYTGVYVVARLCRGERACMRKCKANVAC